MRHRRFTVVACIASLLALSAPSMSGQAVEKSGVMTLPRPTGPWAVGTVVASLTITPVLSGGERLVRPINIQLWYPARRTARTTRATYVEPALLDSMVAAGYLDTPVARIRGWANVRLDAWLAARPAPAPRSQGWPVLVLLPGMGVARAQYSALSQELASHGYAVLLLDNPYAGFALAPDGRLLQAGGDSLRARMSAASTTFNLDSAFALRVRLSAGDADSVVLFAARRAATSAARDWPKLDTTRVGILGHSLGGAAALEACRASSLFRACADMDGAAGADAASRGVTKPFLVLLSEPAPARQPPADSAEANRRRRFAQVGRERDSTWAAIRDIHSDVPSFVLKLVGTAHFSFSDAPFTMPEQLVGVGVSLTPVQQFDRMRRPLLAFFDHFIRGEPLRDLPAAAHR